MKTSYRFMFICCLTLIWQNSALTQAKTIPCVLKTGQILAGLGGALLPGMKPACEASIRTFTQDSFLKLPDGQAAESYWIDSKTDTGIFVNRLKSAGYLLTSSETDRDIHSFILDKPDMRIFITDQPLSPDFLNITASKIIGRLLTFQMKKRRL